jgi:hypothetical protein
MVDDAAEEDSKTENNQYARDAAPDHEQTLTAEPLDRRSGRRLLDWGVDIFRHGNPAITIPQQQ